MLKLTRLEVYGSIFALLFGSQLCRAASGDLVPMLSVPDFNGDGMVDALDVEVFRDEYALEPGVRIPHTDLSYRAFFDANADKWISMADQNKTAIMSGNSSTIFDRELVATYHGMGLEFTPDPKIFGVSLPGFGVQNVTLAAPLLGVTVDLNLRRFTFQTEEGEEIFERVTAPFKGHGHHYVEPLVGLAALALVDFPVISRLKVTGLNVDPKTKTVKGLFWGRAARPLFYMEDGRTPLLMADDDYPEGEDWKDLQVRCLRFNGLNSDQYDDTGCTKPKEFPRLFNSPDESWHAHGGLCQVINKQMKPVVYQFITYNECQSIANYDPQKGAIDPQTREFSDELNSWLNFAMLHLWIDKLNPNGVFGNVHPDVAPDHPSEACVNVRDAPAWFHGTHSHGDGNDDHALVSVCDQPEHQVMLPGSGAQVVNIASILSLSAAALSLLFAY